MRKIAFLAVALLTMLCATGTHTVSANANPAKVATVLGIKAAQLNQKSTTNTKTTNKKATKQLANTPPVTSPSPAPVMVTVTTGDTLSSIAAAHDSTWKRVYDANTAIADPNVINPGDQYRIPESNEQLADRTLPQAVATPAVTSSAHVTVAAATTPLPNDSAKAFIYARESGNNPNSTSPNGCYGLGQDCNGRVRAQCGADYACQDEYFTNYAISRYGSWAAAAAFWQANGWW